MSTLKVDTILKRSGTGTITLGQSGDTLTIPTGASLSLPGGSSGQALTTDGSGTLSFATVGGVNTPYFMANNGSSNQTITSNTETKANFDVERYDSSNCFDTSTGRFTPNVAGKYWLHAQVGVSAFSDNNWDFGYLYIYKNGSVSDGQETHINTAGGTGHFFTMDLTIIADANGSSDYFEVKVTVNDLNGNPAIQGGQYSRFMGYRLIE